MLPIRPPCLAALRCRPGRPPWHEPACDAGPDKSCRRKGEPLRYHLFMRCVIRTLFIWLLVLAVPAQGVAAATMAFCGPNHHGGGASAQTQTDTSAAHAHPGGAATDHQHPQAVALADEDSVASADSAASTTLSHAGQQKCSACASCCSLGAMLSSELDVPAPTLGATVFSTVVPSVEAIAAEGPDRPPRFVFA